MCRLRPGEELPVRYRMVSHPDSGSDIPRRHRRGNSDSPAPSDGRSMAAKSGFRVAFGVFYAGRLVGPLLRSSRRVASARCQVADVTSDGACRSENGHRASRKSRTGLAAPDGSRTAWTVERCRKCESARQTITDSMNCSRGKPFVFLLVCLQLRGRRDSAQAGQFTR